MNRFQLIQVVIIVVALFLGYEAIASFIWFINQAVASFQDKFDGSSHYAVLYGINALLFAISFFWLLNKTTTLAIWILSKTDLDPDVKINISVSSFLLGIIVFWGLKVVFESGTEIIVYLFNNFYETTSNSKLSGYQKPSVAGSFIRLLAGIALLRCAKPLSLYFEKQTDEHDPHQISGDVAEEEGA